MLISDVKEILEARVYCGEDGLSGEVLSACGSDLMSDVLAFVKNQSVLLTGLMNPQVVRTAEMMDMKCIVFVRGKSPGENIIDLAREKDIVILSSPCRMFEACGRLYASGLGSPPVPAPPEAHK
jgi:predicted transcriptional regulator